MFLKDDQMRNTVTTPRRPARQQVRANPELLGRIRDWIEREIAFVNHPEFASRDAARRLAESKPDSLDTPCEALSETTVAFVAGLVDAPLLTPDEEVYLFKWMNFLKFRAERQRQRLTLNAPDESQIQRVEADLQQAVEVRNRIVRSNLRLVVALARKLSTSVDQMSELIGEATLPLIRAVELFDIGLGNRFSTYATWAVRNHMLRCLKRRQSTLERVSAQDQLWLDRMPDQRSDPDDEVRRSAQHLDSVQRLLATLTDRERLVITARFGLEGQPHGQSLHDIADRIGLSKERVRQIALAAISKLQGVAKSADISS